MTLCVCKLLSTGIRNCFKQSLTAKSRKRWNVKQHHRQSHSFSSVIFLFYFNRRMLFSRAY